MIHPQPISRVTADDLMSLVSEPSSTPLQVGAVLLLDAQDGLNPAHVLADGFGGSQGTSATRAESSR